MAFCAGYCIGPQTFYASSAPQYRPGLYFCCGCFFVAEVAIFSWYVWVRWENDRRDKRAAEQGVTLEQQNIQGCLFGLQDMTDIQVSVAGGRVFGMVAHLIACRTHISAIAINGRNYDRDDGVLGGEDVLLWFP
jgi:hypothetical protein